MRKGIVYFGILSQLWLNIFAQPDISATETAEPENVYAEILSHLPTLNLEEATSEIIAFLGHKFSPEEQLQIQETLAAMRKKYTFDPAIYQAYLQSLSSVLNSSLIPSQNVEHILYMQKRAAETHSYKNYLRLLRYLETVCEERIIYRTPYQIWYIEGGSLDFSFEEAIATPSASSETLLNKSEEDPNQNENEENVGWDESEEDPSWEEQEIQDWGATDIGVTDSWSNTSAQAKSPVTIDREELYSYKKFTFDPLPSLSLGATLHLKNASFSVVSGKENEKNEAHEENEANEALESEITSIGQGNAKLSILGKQMRIEKVTIPWPTTDEHLKEGTLSLDYLDIYLPSGHLQSSAARLTIEGYLNQENGFFEVTTDQRGRLVPIFRSYSTDLSLRLSYRSSVSYKGGVSVHGTTLLGASATHTPGTLTITNSKGYTIQAKDKLFRFLPDHITSHHSEILIDHKNGIIDHPEVHLNYDDQQKRVFILRTEGLYKDTPFLATHLGVYMKIDAINWYIDQDQLSLNMHRAKQVVSAVFESVDYFSEARYKRIPGMLPFHPLLAVIKYAKEHLTNEFLIHELSGAYQLPIQQLHSGIQFLAQQRYIHYEKDIGAITVLDKAFHYVFSNIAKNDYDHLLIPSKTIEGSNAVLDLGKNEIQVNGVETVYLTEDSKVFIKPENKKIRLQEDRNLTFDGELYSQTIKYKGKDFFFNYEDYTIQMPVIEEMTFHIQSKSDSLSSQKEYHDVENGKLVELGGIFYIAHPDQKSGRQQNMAYPKFVSSDDAVVYFDSPKILGGAYDRSVQFTTPPFSEDSINSEDFTVVGFDGKFISGGIFPTLDLKLSLMKDNSLGFRHTILSPLGYPLYGRSKSMLRGQIQLNFGGIQGKGMLNHYTTTLQSDKFIFYLDKVVGEIEQGEVKRGNIDLAGHKSYPEITFQNVRLLWQPQEDHMLLKTITKPMSLYNDLMFLTGTLNIKKDGAFAAGMMSTEFVEARSEYFHFQDKSFSARQTDFNILSDDPEKHAVAGKRIDIRYDLSKNTAHMTPERDGIPSIDFPYMHMKTSIHDAIWDHNTNTIHMTNPPGTDLEYSFFQTTLPDEKSLRFQASEATYFMDSLLLYIKGVPYVRILGVDISPYDSQLVVGADADIEELTGATLYINSDNKYHTLTEGEIKIHSAEKFTGSARYQHITSSNDTSHIEFNEFLAEEMRLRNRITKKVIVAESEILEEDEFKTSDGFFFKGDVKMYGHRKNLFFDGAVSLALVDSDESQWISYTSSNRDEEILIDFENTKTNIGQDLTAGLYYNFEYNIDVLFMEDLSEEVGWQIFQPKGFLSFSEKQSLYVIEPRDIQKRLRYEEKVAMEGSDEDFFDEEAMYIEEDEEEYYEEDYSDDESKQVYFHTFRYSPRSQDMIFRGPLSLLKDEKHITLHIAAEGHGNAASHQLEISGIFSLDVEIPKQLLLSMTENIVIAKDELLLDETVLDRAFEQQLSTLIKPKEAQSFSNMDPSDVHASFLYTLSPLLKTNFLFSEINMNWDADEATWYSTGPLSLLHIEGADIYTSIEGYFQITPSEISNQVELFLYLSPEIWYHISYREKNLKIYGSTSEFNTLVQKITKDAVSTPEYYSFTIGNEENTRNFLSEFHHLYARAQKAFEVSYSIPNSSADYEESETYEEEEEYYDEEDYEEEEQQSKRRKSKKAEAIEDNEEEYYDEEYYEEEEQQSKRRKSKKAEAIEDNEEEYYDEEDYEEEEQQSKRRKSKKAEAIEENEEEYYDEEYYEEEEQQSKRRKSKKAEAIEDNEEEYYDEEDYEEEKQQSKRRKSKKAEAIEDNEEEYYEEEDYEEEEQQSKRRKSKKAEAIEDNEEEYYEEEYYEEEKQQSKRRKSKKAEAIEDNEEEYYDEEDYEEEKQKSKRRKSKKAEDIEDSEEEYYEEEYFEEE